MSAASRYESPRCARCGNAAKTLQVTFAVELAPEVVDHALADVDRDVVADHLQEADQQGEITRPPAAKPSSVVFDIASG
ncbi:MAG: hypothetical protein U1E86_28755 [Burkholderiaceae bacterium]